MSQFQIHNLIEQEKFWGWEGEEKPCEFLRKEYLWKQRRRGQTGSL